MSAGKERYFLKYFLCEKLAASGESPYFIFGHTSGETAGVGYSDTGNREKA